MMRKSRFSEDQIIGILKEHQAGVPVSDLCRKHGISDAAFYTWRTKYGGMEVSDARKVKALEEENRKLKKLLAESLSRLLILLRREGQEINRKKLFRLYREERLSVRRRGGRKRALGTRSPMTLPQAPNQRWSL